MVGQATGLVDVGRRDAAAAVEHPSGVLVDRQARAVDRHAEKQAAGAGVRIDLRAQLGVGAGVGGTADRPQRHVCVGAERHLLAADHPLEAPRRRKHKHDVGGLHARLEAEAAATHRHHRRRAPRAVAAANKQHPLAEVDAEDEASLDHVGEDRDALGRGEHGRRDRFNLETTEFVEHPLRGDDRSQFLGGRGQGYLGGDGSGREARDETGDDDRRGAMRKRETHGDPFADARKKAGQKKPGQSSEPGQAESRPIFAGFGAAATSLELSPGASRRV